jgi:DNA polymerase-3 subunit epsilon
MADYLVETDKPISEEITKLTKITPHAVEDYGYDESVVIGQINSFIRKADAVCAHNGTDFDKLFYLETCKRLAITPETKPWIDTRTDLPDRPGTSLILMAAQDGFLNPFPHQALSDVLTMLRILSSYDINIVLRNATEPKVTLRAFQEFADNDKAKVHGFHFKKELGDVWLKTVRASQVQGLLDAVGFEFKVEVWDGKPAKKNSRRR